MIDGDPVGDSLHGNRVLLLCLLILAAIMILIWRYPPANYIDNQALERFVGSIGWYSLPLFVGFGALFTAVGLPRQLLAFTAGFIWGWLPGLLLASLAAIAGCWITYSLAARFLSVAVASKYPRLKSALDRFVGRDAFTKIVILRIQPLGTNLLTNLAAGISDIRPRVFLSASLLGYLPQMLVFSLSGDGVRVGSQWQLTLSVVLLAISLLFAWHLHRKGTLLG